MTYYPQPYQPYMPPPRREKKVSALGLTSVTFALLGVVCALVPFCGAPFAVIFAVIGVIFGVVGVLGATGGHTSPLVPLVGILLSVVAGVMPFAWIALFGVAHKLGTAGDYDGNAETRPAETRQATTKPATRTLTRPATVLPSSR